MNDTVTLCRNILPFVHSPLQVTVRDTASIDVLCNPNGHMLQ